jgi:N-methylhydantoinase B
MDHGRTGPAGVQGGSDGGPNRIMVRRKGEPDYVLPHFSKDQGLHVAENDTVHVSTPGGGGYGKAFERDPNAVGRDVSFGYYTAEEAAKRFGVAVDPKSFAVDAKATQELRRRTA